MTIELTPLSILSLFKSISVDQIPLLIWVSLGLILCLVLTSICAASENSLFSHRESDIEQLREEDSPTAKRLLHMLARPKSLLAAILVVNSFGVVAFVLLSNVLIDTVFIIDGSPWIRFFVDAIGITLVILIFGEVIPKVYATQFYRKSARMVARPMRFFMRISRPLTRILVASSGFLEKRIEANMPELSADELSQAIDIASYSAGASQEKEILKGIVNIGQISVTQIMKPRLDIAALFEKDSFKDVLDFVATNKYSRIPVYNETSDNITGIIYTKDLIPHLQRGEEYKWHSLMRDPLFVPENKKIDNLLREFKEKRNHIAIVVDEFGGTQGLVTLEDILEEVFGEINDEYDEIDTNYSVLDKNNFVFEGKISLVDFIRITNLNLNYFESSNTENDTLGGFITEIYGKIPTKNAQIKYEQLTFIVESSNQRKINRVKVIISDEEV